MQTQKTNTVSPLVLTMKVTPDAMLGHVITAAKTTRTAALTLCYAAAAFILNVNMFTHAQAKGFMERGKAVDHLIDTIQEKTDVKGNMLDIYIRNASKLAGIFSGNPTLFGAQIKQLAAAETPEAQVEIISAFMDKAVQDKGLARKVESLATLSEALGFKVSRRPAGGNQMTPAKVPERITNTMKQVEELVTAGKVQEKQVAQTVALAVSNKVTLAREAIDQINDENDLDVLEAHIEKRRKVIAADHKRAKEQAADAAKEAAKNAKAVKALSSKKRNGKVTRVAA